MKKINENTNAPRPGSRWGFDWADAAVPVLASFCWVLRRGQEDPVAIVGGGIGYALAVALLFCGLRRLLWLASLRLGRPLPRRPALAAGVGILLWGFVIFRR